MAKKAKTQKLLKHLAPKEATKLFNFRVTESERAQLQALAEEYTGGNISAWIKEAIFKYKPHASDLITIKMIKPAS